MTVSILPGHPLTAEMLGGLLRVRTARKQHRCDHWEPTGEPANRMGILPRRYCATPILPGDRHLEYLGESAAFQSGYRYCVEHAAVEWGVVL